MYALCHGLVQNGASLISIMLKINNNPVEIAFSERLAKVAVDDFLMISMF